MKQMINKKLLRSVPLAAMLALMASQSANAALEITYPLDRIVAVVNNQVITALELDKEMELIKQQLRQQNNRLPSDAVQKKQL